MTDEQKRQIEYAAEINGVSVSQWSMGKLMESARRDIAEQQVILLADDAFDAFLDALDAPNDAATEAFIKEKTAWE